MVDAEMGYSRGRMEARETDSIPKHRSDPLFCPLFTRSVSPGWSLFRRSLCRHLCLRRLFLKWFMYCSLSCTLTFRHSDLPTTAMILRLPYSLQALLVISSTFLTPSVGRPSLSSSRLSTRAVNDSLSAVCAPSQCIQGANSLSAGTTVSTPLNKTSRNTLLLPGTYSSASATSANTSLLTFGTWSTSTDSAGFKSSGTLSGTFTVALEPGLVAYSSPLFEGTPTYNRLSATSISVNGTVASFLLSSNTWAILNVGGDSGSRVVAWTGIADVGNIVGGSGGVSLAGFQSSTCSAPCASGGICLSNSTCACFHGYTGPTCNACAPGFFGPTCQPCAIGCPTCDQGITGTGHCLTTNLTSVASVCNCVNGICASSSATATCGCNAGWTAAANGTQCASCASGYFMSSGGDCLACDPSCESCSSPSGTCVTCQSGLQPLSTDATKCTTASTALANGTFIDCRERTFFDIRSSTCLDCNPLCESCFATGTAGCLSCRSPNGLLDGACVGVSSTTGICDSRGLNTTVSKNAQWVYDNAKEECDAIPAKCTAAAINGFTSASTRSQLTCSSCLAGTLLSAGTCVEACPAGTMAAVNGTSCIACDSSCSSCSGTSTYCTACANLDQFSLNGTCVASCPMGFFSSTNATCLACHPDCATCGPTFDTCLTCPSTRPVLSSSGTCLQTCSSNQYFDHPTGSCVACSSSCETCSGNGSGDCLSCGSTATLSSGNCVDAGCTVVDGFGVCLSQLVTISAPSVSDGIKIKIILPWWTILLIVLCVVGFIGVVAWFWRRRERKRRQRQTARFADNLGNKEVDLKLKQLPQHIAYPPMPPTRSDNYNIPLTPRLDQYPNTAGTDASSRWSGSSYGSKATVVKPLKKQDTGLSGYSLTSNSGKKVTFGDRNPFKTAF